MSLLNLAPCYRSDGYHNAWLNHGVIIMVNAQAAVASAVHDELRREMSGNQSKETVSGVEVQEVFQPFVSEGCVVVGEGGEESHYPINILRDTGAAQSIILESAPPQSGSATGTSVLLEGVGGFATTFSCAQIWYQDL